VLDRKDHDLIQIPPLKDGETEVIIIGIIYSESIVSDRARTGTQAFPYPGRLLLFYPFNDPRKQGGEVYFLYIYNKMKWPG
jgi:hypothetical protein